MSTVRVPVRVLSRRKYDRNKFCLRIGTSYIFLKMTLSHTHKTRFWYILGISFKISDDHSVTFIPPTLGCCAIFQLLWKVMFV